MVRRSGILKRYTIGALAFMLAMATSVFAEVTASIDRVSVDLNESFILEILVDTNTDAEPDLSVLDEQYYRGQVSQLQNTFITNGQIRRSRTWTIPLMAKSTGKQEIPAIAVGSESSQPLSVTINKPSEELPGEADVFVTSEVDHTEAYVQSQILYRFKVYRGVPTRQERRGNPSISGAEVLAENAGDERNYEAIINNRPYSVLERVVAIYPQSSGEITISPAVFEARVLRDGRITGRKVFESEAHTVKILPIPAPPAEFPDAVWLPARDVQLSEEWSRDPNEVAAGEPVTRRVTIGALGQIETQIPALDPPEVDGMNVYADKPDLSRQLEADGIRGIRQDQYAMIGTRAGPVEIPQLDVPWWDVVAGEWKVATLPSRTIHVDAPIASVANEPPVASVNAPDNAEKTDSQFVPTSDGFWKRASQLIAGVWLLTIFAWWWSSRETNSEPRAAEPPPIYKQQAKVVKTIRKAANAGDKATVRSAILEWAALQWPDNSPRSIGAIAKRVAAPLSDELDALSASSYGSGGDAWNGAGLAQAIRSVKIREDVRGPAERELLPPLMPPGV